MADPRERPAPAASSDDHTHTTADPTLNGTARMLFVDGEGDLDTDPSHTCYDEDADVVCTAEVIDAEYKVSQQPTLDRVIGVCEFGRPAEFAQQSTLLLLLENRDTRRLIGSSLDAVQICTITETCVSAAHAVRAMLEDAVRLRCPMALHLHEYDELLDSTSSAAYVGKLVDRLRYGSRTTIGMLCLRSNTFTESILPALAGLAKGHYTGFEVLDLLQKMRLDDDERDEPLVYVATSVLCDLAVSKTASVLGNEAKIADVAKATHIEVDVVTTILESLKEHGACSHLRPPPSPHDL